MDEIVSTHGIEEAIPILDQQIDNTIQNIDQIQEVIMNFQNISPEEKRFMCSSIATNFPMFLIFIDNLNRDVEVQKQVITMLKNKLDIVRNVINTIEHFQNKRRNHSGGRRKSRKYKK
jgi:hypothetical protein